MMKITLICQVGKHRRFFWAGFVFSFSLNVHNEPFILSEMIIDCLKQPEMLVVRTHERPQKVLLDAGMCEFY